MTDESFTVLGVGGGERTARELTEELDVPEPRLLTTPDADSALETVRTGRVDCVVSAQSLPDGTGVELLRNVRATRPDLPFVLVGDRLEGSVATDAVDAGVTDYVTHDSGDGHLRMAASRVESATSERATRGGDSRRALTLESALSELPVVVSVCDADGAIQSVEGSLQDVLDSSRASTGNTVEELFGEQPDLAAACNRALDGERVESAVEIDDRVFEMVHSPVREEGEVVGASMVALEVTERVKRERELAETEDVLHSVFENARDAILVLDPEAGAIRRANPAACELLEYDREELLATDPEAIHPREVERFREFVGTVLAEGEGWTDELRCLTGSGTVVPAEVSASAITLDGRPHVLAIVRDVTDRKVYEHRLAALNELGQELATVHEPTAIAERVVDVAERVLDQPLTAIWKHDPAENRLVPLAATDRAAELPESPADEPAVPPLHEGSFEMRVFREGEPRTVEDYATVADPGHPGAPLGTVLMIPVGEFGLLNVGSQEVEPFSDSERHLIQILARVAETSLDRAESRRELERQNERLAEFASVVSHDLRNPLEVAEGYLEQARRDPKAQYFDEMEAALERMERLIDDVLTLAREGETVSDFEAVELSEAVREAWSLTAGDDAELFVDGDLGTVACDYDRLVRLLGNLLANAIEHGSSPPGGGNDGADPPTITVGPHPEGFYVADDGPGIHPRDRGTVFDSGVSETSDGTGLGLAIVRRIAEAHGWSVRATESEDGGARFEVTGIERR